MCAPQHSTAVEHVNKVGCDIIRRFAQLVSQQREILFHSARSLPMQIINRFRLASAAGSAMDQHLDDVSETEHPRVEFLKKSM